MKNSTIRIAVLALALSVVWTAADAKTMADTASKGMLQKANDLIGMTVQDSRGQNIGTIVDLVLDKSLNTVSYAVFSHHTSRQGWQHFAVPFNEITLNSSGDAVLLNADVAELRDLAETDLRVSRGWFQGPVDVEWAPVEERQYARDYYTTKQPLIDIYGRPIAGRARTPYVQNVYKNPVDAKVPLKDQAYGESKWRAYERDQYGRPVYERDYYVGGESFGHDGYSVQERMGLRDNQLYGRPIYRGAEPSRSDWRWGDSSLKSDYDLYGRPLGYDRFGKPLEYDRYSKPLEYDRYGKPLESDRYGKPLESDRYGKPLESDRYGKPLEYDRYGKPLESDRYGKPLESDRYGGPMSEDTWRDREFGRTSGRTGRDMSAWFKTDWGYDADRLGLRRISNLVGTGVAVRGQDAGNIEDLVIDMREGHIAYMLISLTDAFAGSPNRMAAIPWQAIDLMPGQRLASINISRQQLLRLAFTQDNMPNLEDTAYARRLHEQFEVSPYWEVLGYVEPTGVTNISGAAWGADSWYAQSFDPENVTTFSGTIESVSTFKPAPGASAGLRLRIRTDDGRMMLVNAGPSGFATQKGVTFDAGDRITVTGSRAQIAGQNVILASQLKKDDQTVQLRTRQGRPLW